jgi:sporulation protein YlmC with PRC-barrel domain
VRSPPSAPRSLTRKNNRVLGDQEKLDEGHAIHYSAVQPGTPIYSSDGIEVGRVEVILDNHKEHIFDGLVFKDAGGVLRFADAPEVARTAERAVTLTLDAEQAQHLGPPEKGHLKFVPNLRAGRLGRLFGGGWRRH